MKILSKEAWSQIIDLLCFIVKTIIGNGHTKKRDTHM